MAAKKKQQTFEEQLADVEKLIQEMENGGLPLEQTLQHYEQGILLLNSLEKELGQVKQRLSVLRENADGSVVEEALEDGE